ncbi:hypothetical protein NG799_23060 [Laspinema sp. D1]|uniref:Uncharacterized protein n=1 Tax=Laspinema palackyanum D2a TaxID=2953684 RepID=A0ABT2MWR5_9CYAN|nr:hypothetical protein [Laspinema sp. D2a]
MAYSLGRSVRHTQTDRLTEPKQDWPRAKTEWPYFPGRRMAPSFEAIASRHSCAYRPANIKPIA